MIAAAAAVAARLRERLLGGTEPDEIVQAARAAQVELLGKESGLLRALDPKSAAFAIGDKERIAAFAELLAVEADALRAAGDSGGADALSGRAGALRDLARAKKEQP